MRANTDGTMTERIKLPTSLRGLKAWLEGATQGRALLGILTAEALAKHLGERCRKCHNMRPYPKALIVLRRLGEYPGAEVYAEEGVLVRFVELPEMSDERVDEFIELRLPRNWRHLMGLPAKRIHSDVFRGMTLQECLRHTERAVALREIRTISEHERCE